MDFNDRQRLDAASQDYAEVERARRRDPEVWAAWHDRYYPLLYRYAQVRLSRMEEAEDLASQVFLEALKGIDRFKYQGRPVLAWLYGIAGKLVLKQRRQISRDPLPLDEGVRSQKAAQDQSEARIVVWSALEKLKDEHREVLILRFLLDLPTAEVARLIGKTEAATYSLQVRALEAAKRTIGAIDLRPVVKGEAA